MEKTKVKRGGGTSPTKGETGQEEGDQSRTGEEIGSAEEGGGGEVQEGGSR